MRVAVVQLAYGDDEPPRQRVERVSDLVCRLAGHDLVLLPELWPAGGYSHRLWAKRAEPLDGPFAERMAAVAAQAGVLLHAGSFVERSKDRDGEHFWNTSLVFAPDGRLLAAYRKIHRFGFGAGERRVMEGGTDVAVVTVEAPSGERFTAGLSTCYDLRFPELYRRQVDAGATVLLVPAAWPAARVVNWELFTRARAVEDQCLLLGANTAGTHARTPMGGLSRVVLPTGELAAAAGPDREEVLSVDVDLGVVARTRETFPVLRDRRLF